MTAENQAVFTDVAFIDYDEIERWRAAGKAHALLDVRERGEYALGQIPGSCPLPRGLIEICLGRMVPWKDVSLVLYSNGNHRSVLAARTCLRMGYRDVRVLGAESTNGPRTDARRCTGSTSSARPSVRSSR